MSTRTEFSLHATYIQLCHMWLLYQISSDVTDIQDEEMLYHVVSSILLLYRTSSLYARVFVTCLQSAMNKVSRRTRHSQCDFSASTNVL